MKFNINILKFLSLTLIFVTGLQFVSSFTDPTALPPNGDSEGPVNEGLQENAKAGQLMVNTSNTPNAIGLTVHELLNIRSSVSDNTRIYINETADGEYESSGVGFLNEGVFKGGIFKTDTTDRIAIWKRGEPVINVGQNGVTSFMGQIQIVDGTQGEGKVLMSDNNGFARWESLAGNPPQQNLPPAYFGGMYSTQFNNPLADNTKACPQGYVAHKVFGRSGYVAATDSDWFWGDEDMTYGSYGDNELFVCYGDPAQVEQVASFGGVYTSLPVQYRFYNGNPYGGGYWCPEGGFTAARALGGPSTYDNRLYYCYSRDLNERWAFPFAGMYSRPFNYCSNPLAWSRQQGYYWGPYACMAEGDWGTPLYDNPVTNGQSCPTGFGKMQVFGWMNSGGGDGAISFDAQIFMCTVNEHVRDLTPDADINDTYP